MNYMRISLSIDVDISKQATRGFADFATNKTPFSTFAASQATPRKPDQPVWLAGNNNALDNSERLEAREDNEEHALAQPTGKSTAQPVTNR
jgi:hypothetical protein